MYNTMGWGLEYLHISVLRYIYKVNKEHKPLYTYNGTYRLYACVYLMLNNLFVLYKRN